MPRRNDLQRIVILGSGPIRIGQAAEFDFSGSQACRALRDDGYEVILINSNPATIQNDPEMAAVEDDIVKDLASKTADGVDNAIHKTMVLQDSAIEISRKFQRYGSSKFWGYQELFKNFYENTHVQISIAVCAHQHA